MKKNQRLSLYVWSGKYQILNKHLPIQLMRSLRLVLNGSNKPGFPLFYLITGFRVPQSCTFEVQRVSYMGNKKTPRYVTFSGVSDTVFPFIRGWWNLETKEGWIQLYQARGKFK